MIFSEEWLKEWIDPKIGADALMDRLTMAGLEADGISAVANDFTGIIVGEVISVQPHSDAKKLQVCSVSDGDNVYQVVCGAPNVRAGMKSPFAKTGAEIIVPESNKPLKIEATKIRGIESNGMLCSAEELGLEEKSDGILELPEFFSPGEDVRRLLKLDDISIELDLTPNRGDCLGIRGLAREIAVLTRQDYKEPSVSEITQQHSNELPIKITAKDQCPRYLGRIINNIDLNVTSPLWMQERLRRSGLRSIDPIVDVTNYVLMELGQPMHAFDYSKLAVGIEVRMAKDNEKLLLLDGKEVNLDPNILVIADHEKAVAMAGVMGGMETAVSDKTKDVFLECAFFSPLAIAGKARMFGMHTDASHRYERGVDYKLQKTAMDRATELLLDIVGGEAGPVTEAVGNLPEAVSVSLTYSKVNSVLGIDMPAEEIRDILRRLGFSVADESDDGMRVIVPSYRFDISIEADLIEELARIFGYDKIPKTSGLMRQSLDFKPEGEVPIRRMCDLLVDLGYQEVVTYSFVDPDHLRLLTKSPDEQVINLQNPISEEMSVMRSSLLPGLVSAYQYNANRQQERLRLFESGLVFSQKGEEVVQTAKLSGLISGERNPINWNNNSQLNDFYDIKGDIEMLLDLRRLKSSFKFLDAEHPSMHPGQCAKITDSEGNEIGHIGALDPFISQELGLDESIFLFELTFSELQKGSIPRAKMLSKYPEVTRDLAFVIDDSVVSADILESVRLNAGDCLVDLRIFDVYQGDAIGKGKKSIALGLTWQDPSRTLSDEEVGTIISSCVKALQEQFNAKLRN